MKPLDMAAEAFGVSPATEVIELRAGNINNTYYVRSGKGEYILQRVNKNAFKDPQALMRNIFLVTEFLAGKMKEAGEDPEDRVLRFLRTGDGEALYVDGEGQYWRAYHYVGRAVAYNQVEKPEHFRQAGKAFGHFQRMLADFPARELTETIPNFHNTVSRYRDFEEAVRRDAAGRAHEVRDLIGAMREREWVCHLIVDRIESGEIPLRVTHNDTKINNVLLDEVTGEEKCVIDLDTVMPGAAAYDFGDAIRFGANTGNEDEEDTGKISLNLDLFRLFAQGFVSETAGILTEKELESLVDGVRVITTEQVMRFLTDYLNGDTYFKIRYPLHNLVRSRAQMALLLDVEKKYDDMRRIVRSVMAEG